MYAIMKLHSRSPQAGAIYPLSPLESKALAGTLETGAMHHLLEMLLRLLRVFASYCYSSISASSFA
jgi:hypothetical protein